MVDDSGRVTRRARRSALLVGLGLLARWWHRVTDRNARTIAELEHLNAELVEARIAERRRLEEVAAELGRSRVEFDRTMSLANDVVWTMEVMPTGELTLTKVSADASGVVGGDVREGIDAAVARMDLVHPEDAEANAAFTAAIRAGEAAEVEERLIGLDGVTRWTWSRGTPRREGDRLFFDGITTNISERHELAAHREALLKREREQIATLEEMHRSRDDFIALAGHELRTPLTVIQGYVEHLLDDPDLSTQHRGHLEIVVRRAALMSDLIDDLFDLAKLDSRVEPIEFSPVRMDELVEQSVEAHESFARDTGGAVQLRADPVVVLGEHKRLRRMIDNLLDNALRYSPSGGEVDVTVTREGDDAVVRVADQGMGIPTDELAFVFDRLFRGRNAIDGRFPGTGLGLSSALAIAEGHGGTVAASSDTGDGSGTTLTVRLPAHEPGHEPAKAPTGS